MKHAILTPPKPHTITLTIAALSLISTLSISAQQIVDPTLTNRTPQQLVEQLNSVDPETRRLSTIQLMAHRNLTESQLTGFIRNATAPETRHRLIHVAMHRFYATYDPNPQAPQAPLDPIIEPPAPPQQPGDAAQAEPQRGPPGALGIGVHPDYIVRSDQHAMLQGPALLVTTTQPGFPAHLHLQKGDLIEGIDDIPVFGQGFSDESFRNQIKEHDAGDTIMLHLIRGDQRFIANVELASYARLDTINTLMTRHGGDPNQVSVWQEHLKKILDGQSISTQRISIDGFITDNPD